MRARFSCRFARTGVTTAAAGTRLRAALAALALLVCPTPQAQDATFQSTVGPAVLCFDDVDPDYFHAYFTAIKAASKREQGAYWFRIAAQLFGAPVTEAFVSDGSSDHRFVGVVSSLPPAQLAEAVGQAGAARFQKRAPADPHSTYRSPSGAEIAHRGKNAILFCRRDRPVP